MPNEASDNSDHDEEINEAIIRRLFERVYSKGELYGVDELIAPGFVGSSIESADAYCGPDGLKSDVIRLRSAFGGFTIEIDDIQLTGGLFAVSWTARGTHEQRFQGIDPVCIVGEVGEEPHGTPITVAGVTEGLIREGKFRKGDMTWNWAEFRRQLGDSVPSGTDTGSHESKTKLSDARGSNRANPKIP